MRKLGLGECLNCAVKIAEKAGVKTGEKASEQNDIYLFVLCNMVCGYIYELNEVECQAELYQKFHDIVSGCPSLEKIRCESNEASWSSLKNISESRLNAMYKTLSETAKHLLNLRYKVNFTMDAKTKSMLDSLAEHSRMSASQWLTHVIWAEAKKADL